MKTSKRMVGMSSRLSHVSPGTDRDKESYHQDFGRWEFQMSFDLPAAVLPINGKIRRFDGGGDLIVRGDIEERFVNRRVAQKLDVPGRPIERDVQGRQFSLLQDDGLPRRRRGLRKGKQGQILGQGDILGGNPGRQLALIEGIVALDVDGGLPSRYFGCQGKTNDFVEGNPAIEIDVADDFLERFGCCLVGVGDFPVFDNDFARRDGP